jgi:hypothetical protein
MQLMISARTRNRRPGRLRLRIPKKPGADGLFISRKEALFGLLLLTLSVLALQQIVASATPAARQETPVSLSAYRA